MSSNWYKLVMKATKVKYGKGLLLKGVPVIFNKKGAELTIGNNVTVKSSFLSNLVGLYSRFERNDDLTVTLFPSSHHSSQIWSDFTAEL